MGSHEDPIKANTSKVFRASRWIRKDTTSEGLTNSTGNIVNPRHAAALALAGATLGLLVPVFLLTLSRLGIIQPSFEMSLWIWPSIIMFLSLDRCCGQRPPTHLVVLVWTESIAMNVLIYSVFTLIVGSSVIKMWNVLKEK
jgi:hypothetical protein